MNRSAPQVLLLMIRIDVFLVQINTIGYLISFKIVLVIGMLLGNRS